MAQEITATKHKRNKMLIFDPTQPSTEEGGVIDRKKRVAAYARVSTELDSQQNSYEAQIDYYSAFIQENPEWEFAGIYSDEGITGTSYKRRDGFNKMVEDASAGLIDLICNTYLELGVDKCDSKRIRESILIDKTKEVLGLNTDEELTRETIHEHIASIESAADNRLRFFLKNGTVKIVEWKNPSRSQSWTPEMRQRARERALKQAKKKEGGND